MYQESKLTEYFCTSKASKLSTSNSLEVDGAQSVSVHVRHNLVHLLLLRLNVKGDSRHGDNRRPSSIQPSIELLAIDTTGATSIELAHCAACHRSIELLAIDTAGAVGFEKIEHLTDVLLALKELLLLVLRVLLL